MNSGSETELQRRQAQDAAAVHNAWLQRFIQLVSMQTGLHIKQQDSEHFRKSIALRMKLLTWSEEEKYARLLETDTAQSKREWEELTLLLTTGESYFFRDKGQFALLQNSILPELIERRKAQRALRIWSAGCSTGEESYSLAMLVDEMLPRREDWNICIIGTDINNESIEKARRGVYRPWSFRMVPPDLQGHYFQKRGTDWELDERIRTMVTFRAGNLHKDVFPNHTSGMYDMDLIVCRNVFIYFDRDVVAAIVAKFIDTLVDSGYLMTGHAELYAQPYSRLRTRFLLGSVIYQRTEAPQSKNAALPTLHPALRTQVAAPERMHPGPRFSGLRAARSAPTMPNEKMPETVSPSLLVEADTLFRNGAYAAAIAKAEHVLQNNPRTGHASSSFEAHYLMAQAYANLGEYDKAAHGCQQALEVDPFAVHPYYLLAQIAEAQEDFSEAKNVLKKVLYLSPSFIAAYLELAALYEKENDTVRARRMRATALELLKTLPPHALIEPYRELTAGELVVYVQREIEP